MTHEDSLTYKTGVWFLKIGVSIFLLMVAFVFARMAYELGVFIVTTGGVKGLAAGAMAVAGALIIAGMVMVLRPPPDSIHRTPGEY
jgi:hypothetical protein